MILFVPPQTLTVNYSNFPIIPRSLSAASSPCQTQKDHLMFKDSLIHPINSPGNHTEYTVTTTSNNNRNPHQSRQMFPVFFFLCIVTSFLANYMNLVASLVKYL